MCQGGTVPARGHMLSVAKKTFLRRGDISSYCILFPWCYIVSLGLGVWMGSSASTWSTCKIGEELVCGTVLLDLEHLTIICFIYLFIYFTNILTSVCLHCMLMGGIPCYSLIDTIYVFKQAF